MRDARTGTPCRSRCALGGSRRRRLRLEAWPVIALHENCLRAVSPERRSNVRPGPGGPRGIVRGFSPASRRRLRTLLACVRWSELPPAQFVTLTFHAWHPDWHERFGAWLEWMRRRELRYLWRVELQERGAPHWHLILWGEPIEVREARRAWSRIANPGSRAHLRYGLHVRKVESYRAAAAYVSKYVAKTDDRARVGPLAHHRAWGASRDLPTAPLYALGCTQHGYDVLARAARRLARARARHRRQPRELYRYGCTIHANPGTLARLVDFIGPWTNAPPDVPPELPPPPLTAHPIEWLTEPRDASARAHSRARAADRPRASSSGTSAAG